MCGRKTYLCHSACVSKACSQPFFCTFSFQLAFARNRPPWEPNITPAAAADRLGAFLGVRTLRPGDVLDADKDAIERLLRATSVLGDGERVVESLDPDLDAALFAHADSVTRRFFGDDIYMRGIVEFSNV